MKKIFFLAALPAFIIGAVLIGGGVWGLAFTHTSIAREEITTPSDAAIPDAPVGGPFTLKAQADVIRAHTLRITEGQVYAEMPREIPALDTDGVEMLDENGNPVMVANASRDIWITATALITALNLAMLAYAVFGLMIAIGLLAIWAGVVVATLNRKMA